MVLISADEAIILETMLIKIPKKLNKGIALCGTGNGMAITLNHHKGIRAGLAWNKEVGALVKEHNNANVLVMPARFISYRMALAIMKTWMETEFAGGRHQRRIDKIQP